MATTCSTCGASATVFAERYINANQPATWCDPGKYQYCKYTVSGEFTCDPPTFYASTPTLSNPSLPPPTVAGVVDQVKRWWKGATTR